MRHLVEEVPISALPDPRRPPRTLLAAYQAHPERFVPQMRAYRHV
jgi:hypothetical protein